MHTAAIVLEHDLAPGRTFYEVGLIRAGRALARVHGRDTREALSQPNVNQEQAERSASICHLRFVL